MNIWFASGNFHKRTELESILGSKIIIPPDINLDFDPDETGSTFLENSLLKARAFRYLLEEKRPALYKSDDPVIADDSGICVDALDGRPGIFSARYGSAGRAAEEGSGTGKINKLSAEERNILLLNEIRDKTLRTARFVCAMVLYYSEDRFFAAQETMEGEIVSGIDSVKGSGGFGYDPVMFIPELKRTAAELSAEEKNSLSHRAKAGRAILKFLSFSA